MALAVPERGTSRLPYKYIPLLLGVGLVYHQKPLAAVTCLFGEVICVIHVKVSTPLRVPTAHYALSSTFNVWNGSWVVARTSTAPLQPTIRPPVASRTFHSYYFGGLSFYWGVIGDAWFSLGFFSLLLTLGHRVSVSSSIYNANILHQPIFWCNIFTFHIHEFTLHSTVSMSYPLKYTQTHDQT